ncbi:MAG: Cof-type HAD-IIB family hydrolase [Lachnospiraceae bacterium]|nr:Cof-type HAD-IIB family hydrolase [Lachnospiraceae bacterium]
MPKIFFIDFDGTLLNDDKSISQKNIDALKRVQEAGDYLAFTTGRPFYGGDFLFEHIGISKKNCFLLCFQGALIYDLYNEKIINTHYMESSLVRELVLDLQERGIYFQAFTKDLMYCFEINDFTKRYIKITNEPHKLVESIEDFIKEDIFKIMAIDYDEKDKLLDFQSYVSFNKKFDCENFFSSEWFLEFTKRGVDKGSALKELAAFLDIRIEDTVAIGDEENDIPMIQAAGVGVAMLNASDDIKVSADEVTTVDNNCGGVAEIINKYVSK